MADSYYNAPSLKELYGNRYKLTFDPAALVDRGLQQDPDYQEIACRYGRIYRFSNEFLAFYCHSGKLTQRIKRECPGLYVRCISSMGEGVFLFRSSEMEKYEPWFMPRKKRVLSAEAKQRLSEQTMSHRFKKKVE